jgi:hypothetical protein
VQIGQNALSNDLFSFRYGDPKLGAQLRANEMLTANKAELYRAKAAQCEERAKNETHRSAREWQLILARVYQVLATEVENQDATGCALAYRCYWFD